MPYEKRFIYLSDVFKIFHNYEHSKLRLFEIIRIFHPHHIAALIYLIENIKKSKSIEPYIPKNLNLHVELKNEKLNFTDKTTFNLNRCNVLTNIFPSVCSKKDCNELTILEFIKLFKTKDYKTTFDFYSKILLNNLCTDLYNSLIQNITIQFPDFMQNDRNEFEKNNTPLVQKFLDYYKIISNESNLISNLNPRNFRYIFRKKNIQILQKPLNIKNYVLQPLYQGFSLVIYTTKNYTRAYNRYGELVKSWLYDEFFNIDATFEIILLPTNAKNVLKSWRYWEYKNDYKIIVVDVFRIENQMFTHLPFSERSKQIPLIKGKNVIDHSELNTIEKIEDEYHKNVNLYNSIVGIMFKKKINTCEKQSKAFYFNLNFYYDFLKDKHCKFDGSVSILPNQLHYSMHIKYEMADYRTVCIVYGDDDEYFYVCSFDYNVLQFKHVGMIPKLKCDCKKYKYYTVNLYIINSQVNIKGVIYLRVYFNRLTHSENKIVGYELKKTTSMYDIPAKFENMVSLF